MDLGLRGSVAVITGGARGIGLATAREFLLEGAAVAIIDRAEEVEAAARSLGAGRVAAVRANVTVFSDLERALEETERRLGPPRHVVHAAAIGSGKYGYPFLNLDPADWEPVLQVNVIGAVNVAHVFAPGLMDRRDGTFTFISSVAALFGSQTDPPYSASKAALLNFAQCMARDLAPYNVRVNSICPGMVKTELNRSVWAAWAETQPPSERRSYEEWAEEKVRRVVPLGRWQDPEDVAAMAVFLASSRARNITGQTVNVDGGYVMR